MIIFIIAASAITLITSLIVLDLCFRITKLEDRVRILETKE